MRKQFILILTLSLLAVLALSSCSLSLAQDVPPPPGYQPPVYEEPEVITGAAPRVLPNPENGRLVYFQQCAACHGPNGLGDGPDSTALPNEVARIGAANVASLASPLEWYSATLQGNPDRFMPAFEDNLSSADVWDLLSYIYTFSARPNVVAQGEGVYFDTCAACHGEDGSGEAEAANLLDADKMVLLSINDIVHKIATGNGNDEHVFSNQLDSSEIEAAALYVRSLLFPLEGETVEEAAGEPDTEESVVEESDAEAPGEESAVETTPEEDSGLVTVFGQVTNASGSGLPEGLEVKLEIYESFEVVYSDAVLVAEDGTYQFKNVLLDPALIYITLVDINGTLFPSAFHMGEQTIGNSIDLPIVIYDATTDPSSLSVSRMHAFFQFTEHGTVQVIHQVSISNRSNSMVAPDRETEPVVTFSLPEGATNLIFQAGSLGNPYVQTEDGFADPTPIIPGENSYEILYAYELPFDRKLEWVLPVDLPTDVAVLFVQGDSVKVESDTLESGGFESVEMDVFQVMVGNNLPSGETIDLTISAPLFSGGEGSLLQNQWFTIILGVVGLGLAGFGAWRFFSPVAEEDQDLELDRDMLIDEIIALDEAFESGELSQDEYQQERGALKSQLNRLMDEEDAS